MFNQLRHCAEYRFFLEKDLSVCSTGWQETVLPSKVWAHIVERYISGMIKEDISHFKPLPYSYHFKCVFLKETFFWLLFKINYNSISSEKPVYILDLCYRAVFTCTPRVSWMLDINHQVTFKTLLRSWLVLILIKTQFIWILFLSRDILEETDERTVNEDSQEVKASQHVLLQLLINFWILQSRGS